MIETVHSYLFSFQKYGSKYESPNKTGYRSYKENYLCNKFQKIFVS